MAERSINITISARNLSKEVWDQLAAAAEKTQSKFEGAGKAGGVFTSILESGFARLTAALSVATLVNKAIDGVLGLGQAAWSAGNRLANMAAKTDLSIGFLQKLQFAAATGSTSLESLTNLAYTLGVNLAGGEGSVVAAVDKVGLSYEALLRMSPDEQFEAVIVALDGMTNAGERNRAGVTLLGRGYRDNAAALKDWNEKTHDFVGASDDQVEALARQKGAWEGLKQKITDATTAKLGAVALWVETGQKERALVQSLTKEQQDYYSELVKVGLGQQYLATIAEERAAKERAASVSQRQDLELLSPAQEAAAIITAALAEAHVKLSPAIRGAAEQLLKMGLSGDEVFAKLKAGGLVTELQHKAITLLGEAYTKTTEKTKKHTADVAAYTDKVMHANAESRVAAEVLRKVGDAGIHLSMGLEKLPGRLIPVGLALNDIEEFAPKAGIAMGEFGVMIGRQLGVEVDTSTFSLNAWLDTLKKLPAEAKPAGSIVRESFDKIADSLVQLAQVSGESFGSVLRDIATFIVAMKIAKESGDGLKKSAGEIGAAFKAGNLNAGVAGFANLASNATQAGVAMAQATSSGSQGMRALKGAATGAQIGMAFGPIGAAVGAAVGAIVGAIRGREKEFQKIASDVGRDMGVKISEGLAKAIEVDSKRLGDRVAASLLHINDIIKEAGGVEAFGVDKAIAKTRDLFVQIQRGKLSATEAGKAFDQAFGSIIPAALDKTTGLISKQALELIQLDEKFGTHAASVAQFVGQQIGNVVGGLTAFFGPYDAASAKLAADQKTLADLQHQWASASGSDQEKLGKQIAAVTKDIETQRGILDATAVTTQGSATAMAGAIMAAFGSLLQQGIPILTAIGQLDPAIASLEGQLGKMGLSGGAAFDTLLSYASLAKDEIAGPAIAAVQGLGQVLVGLNNTGLLNQETFGGLTEQITNTYASLVAQGKDGNAILQLMQPELQTIWELQQKFGYTVDEATQALINQGLEAGTVGDKHKSAADKTVAALEKIGKTLDRIADNLENKVPTAAGVMADKVSKAIDEVPTDITVRFHGEWIPPDERGGVTGRGDQTYTGAQHGGLYTRPTVRVLSEFHQPEVAGSPNAIVDAFAAALKRVGPGAGGGGGLTVVIQAWDSLGIENWLRRGGARQLADALVPVIPDVVKSYGLAR